MVTCLMHWEGRDLETMMASDITIISTSLIVGISVSMLVLQEIGHVPVLEYCSRVM